MERTRRKQNKPIRFSPTPISSTRTQTRRPKTRCDNDISSAGDLLNDGSLFHCEKCSSTFLDSKVRGVRKKSNVVNPRLRYSSSGEPLLYCRLCGIGHDRLHSAANLPSQQEDNSDSAESHESVKELESFIQTLASRTGVVEASKLACYNPSKRCHCMANYLMSANDLPSEVKSLLNIWNKAAQLKTVKVNTQPIGSKDRKVGLGNGKKRSKVYETFVLSERRKLREGLNLCEHTTQKILQYSNNFLHKSLLTEKKRTRVGEKSRCNLMPVTILWKHQCCRDNCTRMTRTHLNLVVKWRELAVESRRGLQQAIAELLTPTAGAKTNCYKFVTMVTGCSTATVAKVAKKIKKNGGVLGMHEHGLRNYWRLRREADAGEEVSSDEEELPNVWSLPQHHPDEVELRQTVDKQSKELELLKGRLSEKEKKIEEQQETLTALSKKQVVNSNHVLTSPAAHHSWSSDSQNNRLTQSGSGWGDSTSRLIVDTGSHPSPQYPRRKVVSPSHSSHLLKATSTSDDNSATKSLLQPSKLDTGLKLQESRLQHLQQLHSNSYVVATSKQPSTAVQYEQHQPSLQAMQYFYSSNPDLSASSQPNLLFNHQHLQTSDHFTNFGHINPYYNLSAAQNMFTSDFSAYSTDVGKVGLDGNIGMFSATRQTDSIRNIWGDSSSNHFQFNLQGTDNMNTSRPVTTVAMPTEFYS